MDEFAERMVPDGLWEITAPLIPQYAKRALGGGIAQVEDRTAFCATSAAQPRLARKRGPFAPLSWVFAAVCQDCTGCELLLT